MIKLNLNLDPRQTVAFRTVEEMKKAILKNPFRYDGLCFFQSPADEDCLVNLRFVEGYNVWEVEESPKFESSSYTLDEAVDEFIDALNRLRVI